ncbi:MAG: hypothetical protein QXI36_06090 [Candidatus Bathyarchaeia archaeon]
MIKMAAESTKATLKSGVKVYYQGRWVDVSEVVSVKHAKVKLKQARVELARRIIKELLKTPRNCVRRSVLIRLSREVAGEMGLKRLGYRFLITQGIIGRPAGSKLYYLTEKAKELYPDLFPS